MLSLADRLDRMAQEYERKADTLEADAVAFRASGLYLHAQIERSKAATIREAMAVVTNRSASPSE